MAHPIIDPEVTRHPHYASLLDAAEDGIITIGLTQKIVGFNRGAERIFGLTRAEALGQPLDILIPRRFESGHRRYVEEFAKSQVESRLMGERSEVYGRRKDGSEFPADVSISKFTVDDQLFLAAIVRDATERKRYETDILKLNQELEERVAERTAELLESTRQLQRKNEENETFVYSVSHDLRSPLVNLEGFSQELRTVSAELRRLLTGSDIPAAVRVRAERMIDHDIAESLGYIEAAVSRLGRIIDALLRLSRAGRVEYHFQIVDTNQLIRRIVDSLHGSIVKIGAEVAVFGLLPPAWGDPVALEQVFANLIGNALKYLDPARPGRIEIGCQSSEDNHRTFYVRDNGLGIPTGYLPQLFQAFRRLHPDVAGGEGMGLAIVRRVVQRHGGRIWAESEPGRGTTFFVTFPDSAGHDHGDLNGEGHGERSLENPSGRG